MVWESLLVVKNVAKKMYQKRCKVGPKNGSKKRVWPWFNNGSKLGKNVFWAFFQKNQQNSTKKFGKVLCEIGKMLKIQKK